MKYAVRVLRRAQRDLQQIYDYLDTETPRQADGLVAELVEAIESLATFAKRGMIPRDEVLRQRGYRFLVVHQYLIFYKVLRKRVRVYRVPHGKHAYSDIL